LRRDVDVNHSKLITLALAVLFGLGISAPATASRGDWKAQNLRGIRAGRWSPPVRNPGSRTFTRPEIVFEENDKAPAAEKPAPAHRGAGPATFALGTFRFSGPGLPLDNFPPAVPAVLRL